MRTMLSAESFCVINVPNIPKDEKEQMQRLENAEIVMHMFEFDI